MNSNLNDDIRNASYLYSVNLLRLLLHMQLITQQEYADILAVNAERNGVNIYCV